MNHIYRFNKVWTCINSDFRIKKKNDLPISRAKGEKDVGGSKMNEKYNPNWIEIVYLKNMKLYIQ